MTMDDARLLEHYIHRGHGPWNVSLEASFLDYELRRVLAERMPTRRPLRVCNVGIGVGLWDDWLGHLVGGPIASPQGARSRQGARSLASSLPSPDRSALTCVDRDRDICEVFTLRQRRERHPYPARVICGDVLAGALDDEQFDVITCIGSTLGESGDAVGLRQAMLSALARRGDAMLFVAEVREGVGMHGVVLACSFTGPDGRAIHGT